MSKRYGTIAFTDDVRAVQAEHGSETFYGRKADAGASSPGPDPLTEDEKEFLAERDGFYLASIGETGWPYVQFRGGTAGFVHVLDDHTIGWADFRGNLQYISTGNMAGDDRVALIAVDYAHRRRLKIFGHARIVTADADADLLRSLSDDNYDAVVERAVVVAVEAYDWNCPQHITPRFTVAELDSALAPTRSRLAALEAENADLRKRLSQRNS
ncbi:pyridoxamine 5-phosphate oxidase [Mycolicibacterium chubuense]|uniref:pyridoxamine 5'-phosphate oxidase family protein n=1 Tax=Mycolicibacterium chubuense TaxID=1800 RepID=UPI0009F3C9A8|nr:pyridoxamine 5'-phosphate oxidase family protein [Mycolicibacterium chubuense]ORA54953.1 pyridoxamine 5-phosphate oxidase [Mycolicibacterium chubuense]SPX97651.1 pyridoxamine 5'-phosphate oxidase-like protein [Mycolicibacterium chubuense]